MASAEIALSVKNVGVRFTRADGGNVTALDRFSLEVTKGEFVCVLGRSGHGKTTLLNVVAGLQSAHSGEIAVVGKRVTGPGTDRGVIFQRDAVFPWMKVEDNVAFGLRVRGIGKAERLKIAREQLGLVSLSHVARAWPRELSGGMRARVAIAAVFANDPPILLADEPFGALDYVTRRQLQSVLLDMWRRTGKTVLFVTHDVDEALMLGTRVVVVADGSIAEDCAIDLPFPRQDDDLASQNALHLKHLLLHHMGLE